ncbi:MAG: DUF1223 domain-containing protein [Parasphingorhabdus sp.]|uniref:DUF1223 domain-containing protein n=1 Tax=Parasphingorhabdus sp. TaxID=2709688 RepID=UPI0030026F67
MMRHIILSAMVAAAAFAGFMGVQVAQTSSDVPAQIASPPQIFGNETVSPNPVVVELFTSQGCSSCPPADMLASRLAKDSSLLVITRPVTYWDRLGWKDTLAREDNTRLQRNYAAKGNTGSGVYTPQMVVNGGGGAVGSREGDIRSLVRLAKTNDGPIIEAQRTSNGTVAVNITGKSRYMAGISLLALSSSENVSVGRGENGGRKLHYTNVVKAERNLGSWDGNSARITLTGEDLNISGADKYAIIVQRPGAGKIIGAKLLEI